MKTLNGLLDANGKPGEIEVSLKGGEKELMEFTKDEVSTAGSTSKCFVLTAPGDLISVDIRAGAHTADVFDLEVDGILRTSISSKGLAKAFHGTINKVCFMGIKNKSGKREGAKYCGMKVQRRDASMDAALTRNGTISAVSSLVIKAWRKNADTQMLTEAADEAAPALNTYEEYATWQELKHYISKEGPQPPFQIGFIDSTNLTKKQKDKMDEIHKRKPRDYTLFATLIFCLQSTDNLATLGFENVPTYTPVPPPAKAPRAKKGPKAKKSQVDENDELEDDGVSVVEGEERKKEKKVPETSLCDNESEEEGRWVLKSKIESQLKSEPKPKTPKAPLITFEPQPTVRGIINSLLLPKLRPESKEAGKSLGYSPLQMFSDLPAVGSESSLKKHINGEASASNSNSTADSRTIDNTYVPRAPQENGVGEDIDSNPTDEILSANKQKGLVLHGEVGGPARRAFLARGNTPEIESLPQVNPTKLITETTEIVTENSFTAINHNKARVFSPIHESPEFEPLTPPVSAKKPLPERNNLEFAHRLTSGQTHTLPLGQHIPIDLNKLSTLSQATAALTQDKSSHLEVPGVQEPPVNIEKIIKDLKILSRESELARASSPALSEATEVADPMESMESVKNSQRVSYGSYEVQYDYAPSRQNGFYREGEEPATPTGSFSFPQSEKRKAEAMAGRSEYEEPRKATVAPSMGKTSLEEKMIKAKAKLAAATERNRKLEEKRQAAMVIKKENDEVEALLRKAEEMEQTNAELEAEIVALLGSGFGA